MVSDTPAGRSLFNRNREKVADAVGGLADALRETGRKLEADDRARGAGPYADRVAHYAERAADYLRQHDLQSVLREGEHMAHRHPAAFLGGCFAAGLLVGRLLRSGIQVRHEGTEEEASMEEVPDLGTESTAPAGPGPLESTLPGVAEAEAGRPIAEGGRTADTGVDPLRTNLEKGGL